MQKDFHYYATYAAAYIAGYSHWDSQKIAYSAQFVDLCSETYLAKIRAPLSAATTQLQLELMDMRTDPIGLQKITRIWSSFHFLPYDLHAKRKKCSKRYLDKYRLICNINGELLKGTVVMARARESLQAVGIAMHVLADTWAHSYFAGTPSLVINNTNYYFYEIFPDGSEKQIAFRHSASKEDDLDNSLYTNSVYQSNENSIMNLGHGRAGHLPDYSFIRYKYLPAWGDYDEIIKDNPSDYYHAFCQMIYAMKYMRGGYPVFETDTYDTAAVADLSDWIWQILTKRQLDSCADWKAFGEYLSGKEIEHFELDRYKSEYMKAPANEKNGTFLGKFIVAALAQKSFVTHNIFESKNPLAGISVDYDKKGFKGIKDYAKLLEYSIVKEEDEWA